MEAQQQVHYRALARARTSHQADLLAGADVQGQVVDDRRRIAGLGAIVEGHPVEADIAARDDERLRVGPVDHGVGTRQRGDAVLHGADLFEQRGHLPHHPMRDAVEPQRHRRRRRDRADTRLSACPQPQRDAGRADDQAHGERVIDDLEAGHHAHLPIDGLQEFGHRALRIARFALRVREQFDRRDVGVRVGDAPRHHRSRVGLHLADGAQARHEIPDRERVRAEPAHERHEQPAIETADDEHDREKIDRDENQDIGEDHPRVAHRERGLHDLGRDPAGEFVLVEAQALREHIAVEMPAQPHGEIAGERLLLDEALQRDQGDAAEQDRAEQQQMSALIREQPRRLDLGEPVDDVAQHAEQQRLERADHGGKEGHCADVAARAARAGPDEREEATRQLRQRSVGIRRDKLFEQAKQ